jgi:hypothetical protein
LGRDGASTRGGGPDEAGPCRTDGSGTGPFAGAGELSTRCAAGNGPFPGVDGISTCRAGVAGGPGSGLTEGGGFGPFAGTYGLSVQSGDPIPDEQGKFNAARQQALLDIPLNKPAKVSGIASQTTEMLELLRDKHIGIGTRIEIKKKFPFDNSLELKIRNQQVVMISEQVAKNILVNHEQ